MRRTASAPNSSCIGEIDAADTDRIFVTVPRAAIRRMTAIRVAHSDVPGGDLSRKSANTLPRAVAITDPVDFIRAGRTPESAARSDRSIASVRRGSAHECRFPGTS